MVTWATELLDKNVANDPLLSKKLAAMTPVLMTALGLELEHERGLRQNPNLDAG